MLLSRGAAKRTYDMASLAFLSQMFQSVSVSLAVNKVHIICRKQDPFSDANRPHMTTRTQMLWLCVSNISGFKEGSLISSITVTTYQRRKKRITDRNASVRGTRRQVQPLYHSDCIKH